MPEEHDIYKSGGVHVTNLRARLGDRAFTISNITSVGMTQKVPSYVIPWLVLIAGVCVAGYALIGADAISWSGIIVGGLLFGGALISMDKRKPSYAVLLGSASGESDALTSDDKAQIEEVVQALKQAIIEQG